MVSDNSNQSEEKYLNILTDFGFEQLNFFELNTCKLQSVCTALL